VTRHLLVLVVIAAGCSHAGGRGNTVVMASGADLESMNSLITTHPLAKQVQRYALLTTLVRYDSVLRVTPYLARSWEWSRDRTVLVFRLHPGVLWHDGVPTTAADAAWTLETAKNPATGYPRLRDLGRLKQVVAVDDTTLLLRFSGRQSRIPDVLTDLAILPRHLLAGTPPEEQRRAPWNSAPIGNGPFRFVRHDPNRRWIFAANPEFLPSLGGRPALDRLVIAVVDEPTTKLAALAAGELDFAGIQPAHASFVRRDPKLAVLEYPLLTSYALVFNTRRPPFDRLEARRAVALAIDRPAIVEGYAYGFARIGSSPLPPELGGDTMPPLFAPGRGRVLLGDHPLQFELLTVGSGEAALEQMIQLALARIGVTVVIRQLEATAFLERVYGAAHDFDGAVMGISGDVELGYLRSLVDLTGLTGVDSTVQGALRAVIDSVPATFLYHARGLQGMNRRVQGVRMDLRGELATVMDWRVR
jgi:peptide/nickel transport system substrate-binding protein